MPNTTKPTNVVVIDFAEDGESKAVKSQIIKLLTNLGSIFPNSKFGFVENDEGEGDYIVAGKDEEECKTNLISTLKDWDLWYDGYEEVIEERFTLLN